MNSFEFNKCISYKGAGFLSFFFYLCFSQSNQNTQRLNIPQNPTSALRNLALLTHVLRRIMWNWCNDCAWTSLLPKANVQSSYIRPTISSLPNTFSHVLYLLLTHTPSTMPAITRMVLQVIMRLTCEKKGFWPFVLWSVSAALCSIELRQTRWMLQHH